MPHLLYFGQCERSKRVLVQEPDSAAAVVAGGAGDSSGGTGVQVCTAACWTFVHGMMHGRRRVLCDWPGFFLEVLAAARK